MSLPKKVLFVLTSHDKMGDTGKPTGWYLPEVAHPYYVLKKAGIAMDFASPKGGKAPVDPGSVDAFKEDAECVEFNKNEETQALVNNTKKASEVNAADYGAIFWAGGHGPMWDLVEANPFHDIAAQIYEKQNGIVAAVCHGPAGIVNLKLTNGENLIKGKKVTCFTNKEEDAVGLTAAMPFPLETGLVKSGGHFVAADDWAPNTQVDGRLITGQNPASAAGVGEAIAAALK